MSNILIGISAQAELASTDPVKLEESRGHSIIASKLRDIQRREQEISKNVLNARKTDVANRVNDDNPDVFRRHGAEYVWSVIEQTIDANKDIASTDKLYSIVSSKLGKPVDQGVAEGEDEGIRPQGKILKKLRDIAIMSPTLTFQNFRQSGKEAIITDAMMACKIMKRHFLQNKNQSTAQFIYNLENEIYDFMRGRKLDTPDGNEYTMDLSDLSRGTLGKMKFQTKDSVAEGLDEAVGGNYLYHATGSDINDLKNIISNGLRTNTGNQERTGSKLRALSFTRNWRYALTTKDDDNQGTTGIANGVIFVVDQSILKQKNKMQSVDRPADIINEFKAVLAALPTAERVNDLFQLMDGSVAPAQLAALSQIAGSSTPIMNGRQFILAVAKPYLADKTNQQALANAQSKIKQAISYFVKTSAGKSIASAGGSTGSEYEEVILTPLNYVPFKELGVVGYMINPAVDPANQQAIRNLFAKVGVNEMPIPNSTRPGKGVAEGFSNDMSTEDMIAYLRQHHDTNLHQDYLDHINTFSKFVLKDIPVNSIKTDLPKLDRAKIEQYKQMDFSKAPPIVMGGGYILDGYHRANVAKALGIPTIKAYVGVKGQQGVAEGMFTKGPAIDPIIGKQINNIINRLYIRAKQTKDEYLLGTVQELFDILRNTGGTYSAPGSPGVRDVAEGSAQTYTVLAWKNSTNDSPDVEERDIEAGHARAMAQELKAEGFKVVKIKKQGVAENTATGINKIFNNLGDPVYSNLQRVALLAMQGRQSEAAGRLQSVIKDASTDIQKKITDAVNNIKPVTINGKIADSSTLDKSKQHNDWIINTFIPWVQSLLGKQGVAEGYATEDEQIDGMAQGEIREIIKNAIHIKNNLDKGISLDGWMYSYVTTSNDHLNSVAEQIGNPNIDEQDVDEAWSQKYKNSINCSHPKGFSQKAHCAGKKKHNESIEMEMVCEDCGMCETHCDHENLDEACWKGYHKEGNKKMFGKTYPNCVQNESKEQEKCPHCNGPMFSEALMNEKKDACYYKVKSRYKVWPSAYASGALVKCRKKGASNWGTGSKNESSILEGIEGANESLHDWFTKEKWVRMDTKGNIKGPCAKEPGEGKPKCLPQAKAHSLGKKGRASSAARKRREDPNPERSGKAINVATKKKTKG